MIPPVIPPEILALFQSPGAQSLVQIQKLEYLLARACELVEMLRPRHSFWCWYKTVCKLTVQAPCKRCHIDYLVLELRRKGGLLDEPSPKGQPSVYQCDAGSGSDNRGCGDEIRSGDSNVSSGVPTGSSDSGGTLCQGGFGAADSEDHDSTGPVFD